MTYVKFFLLIIFFDSLILDDEPLWEPLEWSVVQTWVLFIYLFSWAAEVFFSSKYGSYTNRDKLVWISLFKTYYLLVGWFFFNFIIVTVFVTLPFYFEITYSISYMVVWWLWISSYFFFKLISVFVFIFLLSLTLRYILKWSGLFLFYFIIFIIFFIITWIIFFFFIMVGFSYFSFSLEYRSSGWSNISSIINGPLKWGWGLRNRDHFSYHKTPESFWFKNDSQIAASLFFFNVLLFFFLFFLFLQLVAVSRYVFKNKELSFNILTYFILNLKLFFFLINIHLLLIFLSFFYQFIRLPFEFSWFFYITNFFKAVIFLLLDLKFYFKCIIVIC